jgi:hypothetical protein
MIYNHYFYLIFRLTTFYGNQHYFLLLLFSIFLKLFKKKYFINLNKLLTVSYKNCLITQILSVIYNIQHLQKTKLK